LQLSDLLSYEEAVALKDLSRESYKEGKEMHRLTVIARKTANEVHTDSKTGEKYPGYSGSEDTDSHNSHIFANDYCCSNIEVSEGQFHQLTVLQNFFSTQFVQTSDDGHMKLTGNAWLLPAISVPLTLLTLALWAFWVFLMKVTPLPMSERPTPPNILRRSSFRSVRSALSWKREPQPRAINPQKRAHALKTVFSSKNCGKGISNWAYPTEHYAQLACRARRLQPRLGRLERPQ
jgi:hypothetical protein